MLELNQCYNMDCMKGMAQFPDGFFDLAVVDPPYFSGPERRGYYGSKVSKIGVYRDYPVSPVWEIPGRALNSARRRSTSGRSSAIGRATLCTAARESEKQPAPY